MTNPPPTTRTLALAGNPNSGKTTLFNALTGLRQKTGNYPGVTVERRIGRMRAGGSEVGGRESEKRPTTHDSRPTTTDIIDLPGTYSLISDSPDERIAVDVLCGNMPGTPKPDAVVIVVDASNLQRNLYLVSQLIEMRLPMLIALNMTDIAERRGTRVDPDVLAEKLGVPVVPIVAHRGIGIDRLKRAIDHAAIPIEPDWPLPAVFKSAVRELATYVDDYAPRASLSPQALAERLIVGEPVGVTLPPDLVASVEAKREMLKQAGVDPMQADVEAHYAWIEQLSHAVSSPHVDLRIRGTAVPAVADASRPNHGRDAHATQKIHLDYAHKPHLTERADRILLHKVWGLLTFALIMGGIFMAIFFAAAPLMDATEGAIGWVGEKIAARMSEGALKDMWTDAIVAGVGGVLVFVPQIAILFGLLAILEDSGYLARAAFLMDRLLSKVGLTGKAFVPLLSGFACAIPGVMAARTIASPRDRLRTIFVLPFMSCSARLPVYALLIGAFFANYAWWIQGSVMLGLYLLGIAAAFATAWVWKSRSREPVSSFILELPIYKIPQWTTVLRVMWANTWAFVSRAGTIIFALSIVLWALMYWPRLPDSKVAELQAAAESSAAFTPGCFPDHQWTVSEARTNYQRLIDDLPEADGSVLRTIEREERRLNAEAAIAELDASIESQLSSAQLRHSIAGRFGHFIEPAIRPLGFDWKMGVGMVGAFGAREVFVSTMGTVYAVGDDDENVEPLAEQMKADTYADGRPVWTPLVAITMLIWFVLAMQCLSTVAIVRRETGTWKWPLLQIAYMNGLAYAICLIVYQVGRALGA